MKKIIIAVITGIIVACAAPAKAVVPGDTSRTTYTGNGTTRVFTFNFPARSTSHIEVFVNGIKQTAGITVVLNANQDTTPGGKVTFITAPLSTSVIRIDRTRPYIQGYVFPPYSQFKAKDVEGAVDATVEMVQQLDRTRNDDKAAQAARDVAQDQAIADEILARIAGDLDLRSIIANGGGGGGGGGIGDTSSVLATGSNTPRQLRDHLSMFYNVKNFGAVGDGSANDTVAIQLAINAAASAASASNSGGGVSSGGMPSVYFPAGVYRITSALTAPNYLWMEGPRAIIRQDTTGSDILTGVKFNTNIKGLIFRGGRYAISISTSNVDTTIITIDECEFHNQTGAAIYQDGTSPSSLTTVSRSKFYNNSGSANAVKALSGDQISVNDSWVTWRGVVFDITGAGLILKGMFGVPLGNSGTWIKLTNGSAFVDSCRFGGEWGGMVVVDDYSPADLSYPVVPVGVVVRNSQVYAAGLNPFIFHHIPNFVNIENNLGFPDAQGIYLDPSTITNAERLQMGQGNLRMIVRNNVGVGGSLMSHLSDPESVSRYFANNVRGNTFDGYLLVADYAMALNPNDGGPGLNTNHNLTGTPPSCVLGTGTWGETVYSCTWLDDGFWYTSWTAWSTTYLSPGTYTVIYDINVTSDVPVRAEPYQTTTMLLPRGRHLLSTPLVLSSFTPDDDLQNRMGIRLTATAGAEATISRIRIFKGIVDMKTPNTVVYGTSAPTSNAVLWFRGDKVINSNPSAENPEGWICVSQGKPGTWKAMADLAP